MNARAIAPSLMYRRVSLALALLTTSAGCSKEADTARLSVRLVSPPLVRRVTIPGLPGADVWGVQYEVEIRETECVSVWLSFVQIEVLDEGFGLPFGSPNAYDRTQLAALSASQVAACGAGVVLSGFLGSIGGGRPGGPARVIVRAIGTDEKGNSVGIDWNVQSPVQFSP